jgi:hypothetical protein
LFNCYAEFSYAKCCDEFFMLSVAMLSVVMLSVAMLSVAMLSVTMPSFAMLSLVVPGVPSNLQHVLTNFLVVSISMA